jgi:type I restriction enzyme, S subunit
MALCDRVDAARTAREATRDRLTAASLARLNAPDPKTFQDDARFVLDALPALTTRPDQIKQLRQIILNLAVRGNLVPQDPKDEPASELLKRIAKEKMGLVKEGRLPEQRPLPPIEPTDIEFDISPGWQWVRMGAVIRLWNGYAFKSGDFQVEGIPVIRIGDLQRGEVMVDRAVCISDAVAKTLGPEFWIPPEALLIAMSGATTGKVAFNRTGARLLLNQRVGRIEVFVVNVDFIRFFFETIIARNLSISFGTAIPNLSAQQINETIIPLPPLSEQHRIVAKVHELKVLCDRLEANLTGTADIRRRLLDVLLAEALAPPEEPDAIRSNEGVMVHEVV